MAPATVVLAALAATNPGARDTTFVVPEGARIEIEHREGDIRVMGAANREARAVLDDDDGRIRVQSSGGTIRLGSSPSGDGADLLIYLPEDVDVSVVGQEGDVTVAGIVGGSVSVRTADGDVEIDGAGGVSVATLDGSVRISNAGAATVSVTDGDVWLDQVAGAMSISGIDADIIVTNADTRAISVATVDGDVWYDGTLHGNGTYSLSTHDGDVTFAVPENAGARISVSTFDGELDPSFPIQFRGGSVRGGEFTVGDGSAAVTLKSFDGDILLVRPGERTPDLD
ncbi:MAG: DUF4097 family beta strand repeat-containing protein [Gemmatimonadota bacterium]|uniref:DUF4097 family beta strand repeat-containing protein n=1 Tax=Candidatus Palauibacter scopulicola TaxID=3056741 RepID=UPI0023A4ADD5|nr:DUF4097 family beta strand repeat-containing protein [Candidatus Palauibacter scopulicola]MDE2662240.1 DUF4097 family beta strand repeat-containing protein [Candidatus Palauibacter scopulicola]